MTEYSDVPRTNALYEEQERVTAAIDMLDNGGTLASFMVAAPAPPPPSESGPSPYSMPVTIQTAPSEISSALLADVRTWLIQRSNDIEAELKDLGVKGGQTRK